MQKNIFLSIIYLFVLLSLITNEQIQANSDATHWTFNTRDANGEALEIVTPKADRKTLEDANPYALTRSFGNNSGRNNNGNGFNKFKDFFRDAKDSAFYGVSHTTRHLPLEALGFYSAIGALALYECAIAVKSNPTACSEFGQMLEDPISHFSFFVFMSTNHSVSHFLNTGGRSFIPRSAIGYIGMAAGSFISSLTVEFLIDTDIQYIRRTLFKGNKTSIDRDRLSLAYKNAYDKFVLDPLGISRHTPHLISLPLAAFLSSVTHSFLSIIGYQVGHNNLITRVDDFSQKLNTTPTKLIRVNGIYQSRKTIGKRILLPMLRLVVKTGNFFAFTSNPIVGFTFRVGQIVIFFAWNDILHPPIQRAWDLRKHNDEMNDTRISILEHLTTGYERQPIQQSNSISPISFASILSFFTPLPSHQRDLIRERSNIQNGLTTLLNTFPNHNPSYSLGENSQDFPETLLGIPNLTEQIETDLFPGETTRPRGDVLSEHILLFNLHVHNYRETLLNEINMAKMRWEAFFAPATAWQYTTYNFYKHLIETQGQLSFETEPRLPVYTHLSSLRNDPEAHNYYYQYLTPALNTKSKGMLDALYFSSRSLDDSNNVSANRLLNESKVLKFGVEPNVVHELSNSDIQWLNERLSNEHSFLFGEPTENHLSLVSLLNKGFPISQMYDFEDFDLQVRIETVLNAPTSFRLNSDILYTKNTQEIFSFMQFLESQSEGMRHYYVSLANGGWDWDQFYRFNTDDIAIRYEALSMGLPGELLNTKTTYEINNLMEFLESQPRTIQSFYITLANQEWDWDQLLTLTIADINLLMKASQLGLHPEFLKANDIQTISHFVQFLENQPSEDARSQYLESQPSEVMKSHYINIANEKYEKEVEIETKVNIVQGAARHFSSSITEGSRHYGITYYSTLEKLLISMVCGQSFEDIDLIDRGALGLGNLEFNAPRIWRNRPAFCDQIETVHHAFFVEKNGQNTYYYNLLDYVSKNIGYQITLEEFEYFWNNQVLPATEPAKSRYMNRKTDVLVEDMSSVYNDTGYLFFPS